MNHCKTTGLCVNPIFHFKTVIKEKTAVTGNNKPRIYTAIISNTSHLNTLNDHFIAQENYLARSEIKIKASFGWPKSEGLKISPSCNNELKHKLIRANKI